MYTVSRTTLIAAATSLLTLSATMPAFAQGAVVGLDEAEPAWFVTGLHLNPG